MKPIIRLAVFVLLSQALIFSSANAGMCTTKTTTVTTIKKYNCYSQKKYKKPVKHKKHYMYYNGCTPFTCTSATEAMYMERCPGGSYDCYYDLVGNYYVDYDLPVSYDHNIKYNCLASEDPASCS